MNVKKKQARNFSSMSDQSELDTKVFLKPTVEQVDEQWARALVKKGLAIDLADEPEFRKAVLLSCRAGLSYVDGVKADSRLPHRTKLTNVTIPKLDDKLNEQVSKRIDGLITETGVCLAGSELVLILLF